MTTTTSAEQATSEIGSPRRRSCAVRNLGHVSFRRGWRLQLEAVKAVKSGESKDQLMFVEHPATITLGRNSDRSHILASSEVLEARGVVVEETDRGGDVTFHGPGQIVCYPILDLKQWKRDVGAYLRALEEVLIRTVAEFGVRGERVPGCTGVWVEGEKVAAIGVHLSHWVTSHGFALNVSANLDDFGLIIPCGITKPVTSMEKILGQAVPITDVTLALTQQFGEVFDRDITF